MTRFLPQISPAVFLTDFLPQNLRDPSKFAGFSGLYKQLHRQIFPLWLDSGTDFWDFFFLFSSDRIFGLKIIFVFIFGILFIN